MGVRPLSLAIGVLLFPSSPPHKRLQLPQGTPVPGPPPPARRYPHATTPPRPTGTARIRGRVVSADTGTPLRRATRARLGPGGSASIAASTRTPTANTSWRICPPGRYNVFVTRNGYVSLQFGQRRPFESGRPLDVGEAQTVEKIDFALPRGGVIAGRITDELGEPLAGVRMQAMRHQYLPNGQRQLAPAMGRHVWRHREQRPRRISSLWPDARRVHRQRDAFRIGGTVIMPGGAPSPSDSDGHGITYYPGTVNAEQAQPITVALSEEAACPLRLFRRG